MEKFVSALAHESVRWEFEYKVVAKLIYKKCHEKLNILLNIGTGKDSKSTYCNSGFFRSEQVNGK